MKKVILTLAFILSCLNINAQEGLKLGIGLGLDGDLYFDCFSVFKTSDGNKLIAGLGFSSSLEGTYEKYDNISVRRADGYGDRILDYIDDTTCIYGEFGMSFEKYGALKLNAGIRVNRVYQDRYDRSGILGDSGYYSIEDDNHENSGTGGFIGLEYNYFFSKSFGLGLDVNNNSGLAFKAVFGL